MVNGLNAQSAKHRVISIPVDRNGLQMRDPWTGGMDSPQFSVCNLNGDSIPDLFVFDRVSGKVLTYLGNGGYADNMYTYAPQYEDLFPSSMRNWALIRDYNHDGIPDLFTSTGLGTLVMKGDIINGLLHFDTVAPFLKYIYPPFTTNIYTTITDIPVFTDVNGDGDLDVLTYDIFGGTISYYENQTIENIGNPAYNVDSLKYRLITSCWGAAAQNISSNSITLNINPITSNCVTGVLPHNQNNGSPRHSGNSIYAFVDPVYHDIDLLNGNVGYNDLFLLRNCGGREDSLGYICEWDSIFPPCGVPMLMPSYPAAYGVDINGDGLDDILMAPNVYAPYDYASGNSRNTKNVMYFKSTGDTTCWFEYQNDSFLVHHMLDFGTNSRGVFYDFNGDGLMDIIVGNYGYYQSSGPNQYQSSLAYYQNTGNSTEPKFTEVTLDYNNFSNYGLLGMSPTFGDLDGDGKADLIIGAADGFLYYFKNTGTTSSSYPAMTMPHFDSLHVTGYAAPFIYDVNGDSLNDLIVGGDDGHLVYYRNTGTKNNPHFSNNNANHNFGGIDVCEEQFLYGCFSQPFIMKDASGKMKLFVGSIRGIIFEYDIDPAKLDTGSFTLIDSDFLGHYSGANATISIADINNDGNLEYLVGNSAGGLMMYSDSAWDIYTTQIQTPDKTFRIYPNPSSEYFTCSIDNTELVNPYTEVIDILGQKARADVTLQNNKIVINVSGLSNGFYVIRIVNAGKTYKGKVLVIK